MSTDRRPATTTVARPATSHAPQSRLKNVLVIVSLVVLVVLVLIQRTSATPPTDAETDIVLPPVEVTPGANAPPGAPGTALAGLDSLKVGRANDGSGYVREAFGRAWADVDKNGCDTRNDILARDLTTVKYLDNKKCIVASGTLKDPYTGKTIKFVRGPESAKVQIDHVVALQNAWKTGADKWNADTRLQFANDPLNLIAGDGPANSAKGAKDAANWLPPNEKYACAYVARQIAVKHKYGLIVTSAEAAAMREVLATCPAEPLPDA